MKTHDRKIRLKAKRAAGVATAAAREGTARAFNRAERSDRPARIAAFAAEDSAAVAARRIDPALEDARRILAAAEDFLSS